MVTRKKNVLLPGFLTCLNFSGGLFAIIFTIQGEFLIAAWLIICAILCDAFDGLIARKTGSVSDFGFQLDSLADMITSGLAPAIFIYNAVPGQGVFLLISILFYSLSCAYRLARFNVNNKNAPSDYFTGLPAPVAAISLISFWFFRFRSESGYVQIWLILMILIAILMLSDIQYRWPRLNFSNAKLGTNSVFKLLATGTMIVFPGFTIFPFFMIYILHGVGKYFIDLIMNNRL